MPKKRFWALTPSVIYVFVAGKAQNRLIIE